MFAVSAKIVANQLAPPVLQEVASMLSGAAGDEVVNHRCHMCELAGGICPNIGAVGFLCSRYEHLHR